MNADQEKQVMQTLTTHDRANLGIAGDATFDDLVKVYTWRTFNADARNAPSRWIRLVDASTDQLEEILATQPELPEIGRRVILRILRDRRVDPVAKASLPSKDSGADSQLKEERERQVDARSLEELRQDRVLHLVGLQQRLMRILELAITRVRHAPSKSQIKKAGQGLASKLKQEIDFGRPAKQRVWDGEPSLHVASSPCSPDTQDTKGYMFPKETAKAVTFAVYHYRGMEEILAMVQDGIVVKDQKGIYTIDLDIQGVTDLAAKYDVMLRTTEIGVHCLFLDHKGCKFRQR